MRVKRSDSKRHRWCLQVCLDCWLHRSTETLASGNIITEYRREVVIDGVEGIVITRRAGACVREGRWARNARAQEDEPRAG